MSRGSLSGLLFPIHLSLSERLEFMDLVEIVQNATGIEHIANRVEVMFDKDVQPFTTRIRHLLMKDHEIQDMERNDEHRTGPGC